MDGVYRQTGEGLERVEVLDMLPSEVRDVRDKVNVTDGMRGKVEALFAYGQEGRIFSGSEEGATQRALDGERIGTRINPADGRSE